MIQQIVSVAQVPAELASRLAGTVFVQPHIEEEVVQVLVKPAFGTNEVVGFAPNLRETEFPPVVPFPVVPFPFAVQARDVDRTNGTSEICVQSPGSEDGAPELLLLLNEKEIGVIKEAARLGNNLSIARKLFELGMARSCFQKDVDQLFSNIKLKQLVDSPNRYGGLSSNIRDSGVALLRDAIILAENSLHLTFLQKVAARIALDDLGVVQEGTEETRNERFYLSPTKNNERVKLVDIDYETAKADIIHFRNELIHMAEIVDKIPPPPPKAAIA